MAKGFSFVLVTVVMIMMMVFGMLSLSSTKADLRLSRKAVSAQQVYYGMDTDGERLYSDCSGAAAAAWSLSETFAGGNPSLRALPADFYSCLIPLAGKPDASESPLFLRGVFFYELGKQLAGPAKTDGFSYRIDTDALSRAVRTGDADIPVAYVTASVPSRLSPDNSLQITLVCRFGSGETAPSFRKTRWEASVSAPAASDGGQTVHVWGGK